MSLARPLPHAADEAALLLEAVRSKRCCLASLAAALGRDESTVSNYLHGRRNLPGGALLALAAHLDDEGRRWLLLELAERWAVEGDVVDLGRERERRVQLERIRSEIETAAEALERGWKGVLAMRRAA